VRVILLGLDGGSLPVLLPWVRRGDMPYLAGLLERGRWGTLASTYPPLTPSAWASMLTGCNPGQHGLLDYLKVDSQYGVRPVNSSDWKRPALWELVSEAGGRSVVFGVPITYPPRPFQGVMVTDMMSTPDSGCEYTYPADLKGELESAAGGPVLAPVERHRGGDPVAFLDDMRASVRRRARAARYLRDRTEWELFVVVLYVLDMLQHELWHVLARGAASPDTEPRLRDALQGFFRDLDASLALLAGDAGDDIAVVLASDHGGAGVEAFLHVNTWLLERGYLRLQRSIGSQMKRAAFSLGMTPLGAFRLASRAGLGRLRRKVRMGRGTSVMARLFLSLADVDWRRTTAFSVGSFGQVYVNRKGRFAHGIVATSEVPAVTDEIAADALALSDRGKAVVREVLRKEDLYQGVSVEAFPELLLEPEGFRYLCFGESAFGGNRAVEPIVGMSGFHHPNGIFAVAAPGIGPEGNLDAAIVDVAPTVLALLDRPIPEWMDGGELSGRVSPRRAAALPGAPPERPLSARDQDALLKRLKGLGYAG
jgi:predicted AlkP superfamily phosphohydrolase/phosphomutase